MIYCHIYYYISTNIISRICVGARRNNADRARDKSLTVRKPARLPRSSKQARPRRAGHACRPPPAGWLAGRLTHSHSALRTRPKLRTRTRFNCAIFDAAKGLAMYYCEEGVHITNRCTYERCINDMRFVLAGPYNVHLLARCLARALRPRRSYLLHGI